MDRDIHSPYRKLPQEEIFEFEENKPDSAENCQFSIVPLDADEEESQNAENVQEAKTKKLENDRRKLEQELEENLDDLFSVLPTSSTVS